MDANYRQCTAKSKQSQQRCKRRAAPGRNVCIIHGGRTPQGLANGNFKTGRHSKYLPARLLEKFHEADQDPELLSLRAEAKALDALVWDVAQKIETGETPSAWENLGKAWGELTFAQQQLKRAREAGDTDAAAIAQGEAADAMERIGRLIKSGNREREAISQFVAAIKDKKEIVTAEHKRLMDLESLMTVEQVMSFSTALLMLIKKHVTDRAALIKISDEFSRMFNIGAGGSQVAKQLEVVEAVSVAAVAAVPNITTIEQSAPAEQPPSA